jgi:hypothetical protein
MAAVGVSAHQIDLTFVGEGGLLVAPGFIRAHPVHIG